MNERIREFARRVVGKNKNDVGSISLFDEQIEQFAEMLIRECARRCEMSPYPHPNYSVAIKEHFGVK